MKLGEVYSGQWNNKRGCSIEKVQGLNVGLL